MREAAGGIGRYTRELVPAILASEPRVHVVAFVRRDAPSSLFNGAWASEVSWVTLPFTRLRRGGLVAQQIALPRQARARRLDLLHFPGNVGVVPAPGIARVVTIHDLIGIDRDKTQYPLHLALATKALITASARTADRVLTDSEASRQDIVARLRIAQDKVDVVPLGVRPPAVVPAHEDEVRRQLSIDDRRVILCVSQKRPYKNQGRLIEAVVGLEHRDSVLVLVGEPSPYDAELHSLVSRLGAGDRVRILGWVRDDELETLYRVSSVVAFPSLAEGFGLPVLEAMVRDVPVVCSDRPPIPEVAGEAALYFDPTDVAAIRHALERALSDTNLRAQLIRKGRERARKFTWERTARETVACYQRAVEDRRRRSRRGVR